MDDQALSGIAAIVSGGAHGLGREMVLALAAHGASVVVGDISKENLASLSTEVQSNVVGEYADVSDPDDVERIVERCRSDFGHVDIVVNNAGISPWSLRADRATNPIRFWQLSKDDVERFLAVHMLGPLLLSKAALPYLTAQGWGRIVTVTTSLHTMIGVGHAPYGPAKAASEALASVMSKELEGTGVSVNVLIPGAAANTYPERIRADAAALVDPAVMGPPIVWLASRDADGVTGRRIIANQWDTALSGRDNLSIASAPIAWPSEPARGTM